jgi:predicted nucleic acid-binding protein
VSFYLDTNAIYAFIFANAHSTRIDHGLARQSAPVLVSDWVKAEFCALVWRRVRGGGLQLDAAGIGLADFDAFVSNKAQYLALSASAGALAANLARDPLLKLSAADALHLASAADGGHVLVTFDLRLADAARVRGISLEIP